MKSLLIHSDFEYKVRKKTKFAEEINENEKSGKMENCLTIMFGMEKGDESKTGLLEEFASEIKKLAEQIGTESVSIFPFVHIIDKPAEPGFAQKFSREIQKELSKSFKTIYVPFGWIKKWKIETKGHPMAVMSRKF